MAQFVARRSIYDLFDRTSRKIAVIAATMQISEDTDTHPLRRPAAGGDAVTKIEVTALWIERIDIGVWRLSGPRIERSAFITDWDNPHTVARFQRILDAMGIREALRQAGVVDGDTVCIGDFELEWVD